MGITAQAPGFIYRHNEHNAVGEKMSLKATCLFVFIAFMSFLQGHESQSGTGEGTVSVLKHFQF